MSSIYVFRPKSCMHFSSTMCATRPTNQIFLFLYLVKRTSYEAPRFSALSTLPLRPKYLLSSLFRNTLNLCSSLCVRDQVSEAVYFQRSYTTACLGSCTREYVLGYVCSLDSGAGAKLWVPE